MTTSVDQLIEASEAEPIKPFWLGYFREGLRSQIKEALAEAYLEWSSKPNNNQVKLAIKLGKRPEQISRWLSDPGNIRSDTLSDLFFAMGAEPFIEKCSFDKLKKHSHNLDHGRHWESDTPSRRATTLSSGQPIYILETIND